MRAHRKFEGLLKALGVALCLGFAGCAPLRCLASTTINTEDYTIEVWQIEEGLPQISVTSIAQTQDGYLWLGTFNGLVRFDGVRFKVFNEANAPALGSGGILRLLTDERGSLWVMTQEGHLTCLTDGQFKAYGPERGLPACGAEALVRDPEQRLLVVDRELGLHHIENGLLRRFERKEPSTDPEPRLLLAPAQPCWVEVQGKAVNLSRAPVRLPRAGVSDSSHVEVAVACGAPSREGGYWLADKSGVYRLKDGCIQEPTIRFPQQTSALVAMAEDRKGNLWVGSWADGLFRRATNGRWQRFSAGAGLAENDVVALFVDREDNVWVGTGRGGLHRFKPRLVRTYDTRDGLAGNTVMSLTEDRQGRLWVGVNGGGLNRLEEGRFAPVMQPPELRRYPLTYSVLADRAGAIWIGLYGEVALRLQAGEVTPFNLGEGSMRPTTPQALFEDRAGTLWLGCEQALVRYAAGRFTRYTRENGLAHENVRALAEDRSGTLYIGTDGGGLSCLRGNQFSSYTERDGLADNHIGALCVDGDDTVWIGTVDGGLARFQHGRFAALTTRDGLPSNTIGTLVEDDAGHLWMGSNRGIARVNRRELNDYLDGRRPTFTCRVFNRSDGLSGVDCTGGGQPASWKAHDGRLWFATVKGVAVVDPAHVPVNALPPLVVIEEVLADESSVVSNISEERRGTSGRPMPAPTHDAARSLDIQPHQRRLWNAATRPTDRLQIPPRNHRLEFRFTGLSLAAPEKVRFRYRLDGLDNEWSEVGSQRTASYHHVPAGAYRFEVTACNNDGAWNETGASLGLIVLPPWWGTWWFRILAIAGMAGVIFWTIEARVARVRREHAVQGMLSRRLIETQEAERKRIAAELHDGLGQNLLVIKNRAMLGLQDPAATPKSAEQFSEISSVAAASLAGVREVSRNLRPYQLDRLGLARALKSMITSVSAASGIRCLAQIDPLDGLLPSSTEIHCYRILQELLNNVVKHSRASEARVSAVARNSSILLTVEDDGCGFDPAAVQKGAPEQGGMGLSAIAERVRILEGTFRCDSRPASGTRWTIEIPIHSKSPMKLT